MTYSFRPHYGPGVDSACDRNECQEYFLGGEAGRCVGLTTLPSSCADCLEILEPQTPGTLRAYLSLFSDCFTFTWRREKGAFPETLFVLNVDAGWCSNVSQVGTTNDRQNSLKCSVIPPGSKVKRICRVLAMTRCDRLTEHTRRLFLLTT